MSLNFINKLLSQNKLWIALSISFIFILLSPLLFYSGQFYVPIFDNLDSTVVWYKILAESGMIFADNNAIIPNMMSGLPRSSYFKEFDLILWLYYFFETKTAYIINEVLIHLVAFFSMYIFLQRYVVEKNNYYQNVPIFIGALYFALIPYWSGAGLTLVSIPLVSYSLLNIRNHIDTKWDWILLIVLPLYSSFILFYMFYFIFAGIYLLWISIQNKQVHTRLLIALFLFGTIFLLTEYRLLYTMFIDSGFVSHRSEFNIFFKEDLLETYRLSLVQFLFGNVPHAQSLQKHYLLPLILTTLLLTLFNRRFTAKESLIIWVAILLSFIGTFWDSILIHKLTLPSIVILSLISMYCSHKNKYLAMLVIFIILLSIFSMLFKYQGFAFISEVFPIFKALNMTRIGFIQPFIYTILLVLSSMILYKKLHFTSTFLILFIFAQFHLSYSYSSYQTKTREEYASFESYYIPELFKTLKQSILLENNPRFLSYGIEPAVALYNGLYTIDGYAVNYPLSYKYAFQDIFFNTNNIAPSYAHWGSKVYIQNMPHEMKYYQKGLEVSILKVNIDVLCKLNNKYIISPYYLNTTARKEKLLHINTFKGMKDSWDIYLYKVNCQK
ncbi:MAG: DUF6044 family protein [Sulfurovum sp.]|nr:DUF6044 family protein [Sulfurovum sp.]